MLAVLVALSLAGPAAAADTLPLELREAQVLAAPEGVAPLVEASGVVADALGQVWASDAAAHRLVRWNARGAWLGESGALGSDANQFRRPTALARLGSLGVAILDVENRRVVAFDLLGRRTDLVVALEDPALVSVAGRVSPVALASDRGAALYVADSDRDRLLAFDFAGHFQRALGGYGVAAGSFHGLVALAVGTRGEIVTLERPLAPSRRKGAPADSARRGAPARVQRLDAGGTPIASWTLEAEGAREFALAVDDSGRVAVTLAGGREDEVRVFDRDGAPLARLAGLSGPRAAAFAPDGTLLVAEAGAARVRRFTLAPARGE
jgi:DNA-binding beta-propeller fold protein YncE